MTTSGQGLGEGILLRAVWPLRWRTCGEDGDPRAHEERNLHVLEAMESLEGVAEGEEEREERRELRRLEAKLDLLAGVLSRLLAERHPLPPARRIALGAGHILWSQPAGEPPPPVGSRLELDLYPLPAYPVPLRLAVRVRDVTARSGPEPATEVEALLLEPEGTRLKEALERLVFRAHRREVARLRRPAAS